MFIILGFDITIVPRPFVVGDRAVEEKKTYSLLITDSDGGEYRPHYPYAYNKTDIKALKEFVHDFEDEIIAYNCTEKGLYPTFANLLYGFDTDVKIRFRKRWHEKGVSIY